MGDRLDEARRRHTQAHMVRELQGQLRALMDGELTRAQVQAWARALDVRAFGWPTARDVHHALGWLKERDHDGRPRIREHELRAYVGWLERGDDFIADREPLVTLAHERSIDELAAQVLGEPVRAPVEGLGWKLELRFCAPATGRTFVAFASEERRGPVEIRKQRRDTWLEALVDLFEALEIDERDVAALHPEVELEQLPRWSLWRKDDNGNRFEIDRFRSFAKAARKEAEFEARGHRQSYWIEAIA